MGKTLMVPVHMDALYLSTSEAAAEPTADFRGLPYYDPQEKRDVNSDTPWLGESVASPPFENDNMTLQAGVHFHWSLSDGLCRGKVEGGKIKMPAVPNRWLIRRRKVDGVGEEKCWVVESDYLWPPTDQAPAVNILHSSPTGIPYRFLGRKLTWDDWVNDDKSLHKYLKELTAIGHGEPTFAAYYPNCITVFGFHDPELPEGWTTAQYDLIGWYENASSPKLSWEPDAENSNSMIESLRRWRVENGSEELQQLMCYASIKLTNSDNLSVGTGEHKIAVGNTISEALSALLANEVAEELGEPGLVSKIEEQLEALHIEGQLASEVQDLGLRLRRYRHQKSFAPVAGSKRWIVHTDQPGAAPLPANVLSSLRDLNDVQARYGRQSNELAHARRQLYGDWCNYMRGVYRPPDGGRGQFLDIDEIVAYIENRSLEKVERLSSIVEMTENYLKASQDNIANLLVHLNCDAAQAVEAKEVADPGMPARPTQYSLRKAPGARYWRPTDPVVLIAGGKIQFSERHGRDGRNAVDGILQCETYGEEIGSWFDDQWRNKLLDWVVSKWDENLLGTDGSSENCIGFRTVNVAQRPWNPLFLDWGIDMHPAESHSPDVQGGYDRDVITGNYLLGTQNPDLQPGTLYTNDDPDRFSGRCILGATPSIVLRERIEDALQRRLLEGTAELWANATETDYFTEVTDWYQEKPSKLPKNPEELKIMRDWYAERPLRSGTNRSDDPLYCTLLAYQKLFDNIDATDDKANESLRPRAFLGQALSGFNEELIQWKIGLTLPIDEPTGLTPYREFTQRVANAVGSEITWATEPTNNFSPIRSGALKLDKLRLLDSFGQVTDVPCDDKVIVPSPYRISGRRGTAFLPPRLAQPAHVTFRWLDAHPDEPGEMVEAEARSPICGWLLHEKLSGRLLVFDGDGNPLGTLAADKDTNTLEWVRAPGLPRLNDEECEEGRTALQRVSALYYQSAINGQGAANLRDLGELGASIKNNRLARVLLYLWATRSTLFLKDFLNTLDDALANIDPEGTTSMGCTALLVGRPVAVVGAELNLELKDEPAVRQDWEAFLHDQYRHRRDTEDFDQVQFRLRLGQYNSRNDGVLGYWREESEVFFNDTFIAQAADDNDPSIIPQLSGLKARIKAHDSSDAADALNFTQSVAAPPLRTTLLMDPRGRAHLTTGILPVKSIDIPRALWEPALEAIRVWFPVAPILSRPSNRRVPTPTLVDRQWSWLEMQKGDGDREPDVWQTLRSRPSVDRKALEGQLVDLQTERPGTQLPDIPKLIEKGWLKEQAPPDNRLHIVTREDRQPLDNRALEAVLDTLLARLSLALVSPGDEPDFNPRVEVREGWLLLEPGNGAKKE